MKQTGIAIIFLGIGLIFGAIIQYETSKPVPPEVRPGNLYAYFYFGSQLYVEYVTTVSNGVARYNGKLVPLAELIDGRKVDQTGGHLVEVLRTNKDLTYLRNH